MKSVKRNSGWLSEPEKVPVHSVLSSELRSVEIATLKKDEAAAPTLHQSWVIVRRRGNVGSRRSERKRGRSCCTHRCCIVKLELVNSVLLGFPQGISYILHLCPTAMAQHPTSHRRIYITLLESNSISWQYHTLFLISSLQFSCCNLLCLSFSLF